MRNTPAAQAAGVGKKPRQRSAPAGELRKERQKLHLRFRIRPFRQAVLPAGDGRRRNLTLLLRHKPAGRHRKNYKCAERDHRKLQLRRLRQAPERYQRLWNDHFGHK